MDQPGGEPGPPGAQAISNNNFTRTSMIGTFITIQICQFTQPYGSLIFRRSGGSLWRCNPCSSFAEACMILSYLARAMYSSLMQKSSSLRLLQPMAGSLLLLRAANDDDDNNVRIVLAQLGNASVGNREQSDHPVSMQALTTKADIADNSLVTMSADADSPALSWQPSLESGREHGGHRELSHANSTPRTTTALHAAFGSNVLARKDFRVDMLTTFAELCVAVKLLAVRGDGWLSAAAVLLLIGWFSVQSLLTLFHHREMEDEEMLEMVRMASWLDNDMERRERWWDTLLLTLHLPLFVYVSYLGFFHPWIAADATGFLWFLKSCGWFLELIFSMTVGKQSFWSALLFILFGWCGFKRRRRMWKSLSFLILPVFLNWLTVASISYSPQICGTESSKHCIGGYFIGFFSDGTIWHYIFDLGVLHLYKTCWLLLLLVSIAAVYVMFPVPDGLEWDLVAVLTPNRKIVDRAVMVIDRRWSGHKASSVNAIIVLAVSAVFVAR